MTTLSSTPAVGEIWLAYLRFSDRPDFGKVRPVLVLQGEGNARAARAICLKVTSRTADDGRCDVAVKEWERCGLRKPSFVRIDQIFELDRESFLGDRKLGDMNGDEFESILGALGESR